MAALRRALADLDGRESPLAAAAQLVAVIIGARYDFSKWHVAQKLAQHQTNQSLRAMASNQTGAE
jgi:hypothetical protein